MVHIFYAIEFIVVNCTKDYFLLIHISQSIIDSYYNIIHKSPLYQSSKKKNKLIFNPLQSLFLLFLILYPKTLKTIMKYVLFIFTITN